MQMEEVQGTGEYDVDRAGLNKELTFGFFLQWSHESSLPVSNTIVTGWAGVPTRRETVRVTLCRKGSLFVGRGPRGTDPVWIALRANMAEAGEFELCFEWTKTEHT